MKLINHTLLFLSLILFVTVSLWSVLFYFQLLRQVKTNIDDGLANYKIVVIDKLKDDTILPRQDEFLENNYIVKSVSEEYAIKIRDTFKDTVINSTIKGPPYSTRLLTTAFVSSDGKYYEMKVVSQELDRGKLIKKIATSLLWLYLFLFVSTLFVNNFVLKKTWKPFYQILKYMNDFRLDRRVVHEIPETKIKEFALLNGSILNLQKNNVDIYNSQKQFIENASHELQTPLAIGINKLELLAGDDGLSPDHIQKIGNIIEVFQRLSGLNKSLLLLSKIENRQFIAEGPVNFDDIFSRIIVDFSDYAVYQKIDIKYLKQDSWVFKMNSDLAEMLVMNLVKNAIVHNHIGGELIIKLSSSSFTIENTSNGPALRADELFKRFNKNPNSKSSSGLGLAIVKVIADVSGLAISYSYNGKHVFEVSRKSDGEQ